MKWLELYNWIMKYWSKCLISGVLHFNLQLASFRLKIALNHSIVYILEHHRYMRSLPAWCLEMQNSLCCYLTWCLCFCTESFTVHVDVSRQILKRRNSFAFEWTLLLARIGMDWESTVCDERLQRERCCGEVWEWGAEVARAY